MGKFIDVGASFNEARSHRQELGRLWDKGKPKLIAICMNPSTADETNSDNTVSTLEKRAKNMGYGSLTMLNILDVVETDSRRLKEMSPAERCTPENKKFLKCALDAAEKGEADIFCGWGGAGQKFGEVKWLLCEAGSRNITLFCFWKNNDGSPKHPRSVPLETEFSWFGGVNEEDALLPLVGTASRH